MDITESNWKKTFAMIWAGQALSLIGSQMVSFSVAWWVTQSTGSAAVLVTMSIFGMLPQVVLGPFIGALVDRWNRQRVMIVADGIMALFALVLALLFWTGNAQIWYLYVMALVRGTMGTFHWTAMQASTSLMVPEKELSRVAGLNQTLNGVLSIAAPPLGALVVGLFPMGPIMMIDVVTAILAIFPLLIVHIPQPANVAQNQTSVRQVLADVRAGFAYVWAWPGLVIVLFMATLINFLLNPTGTLMPLLVTRHFNGGAWHLSALESSFAVGMILGGLLLSVWGGFKKRIMTMMVFLVVMGVAQLFTGAAPKEFFWLAVVGGVLGGITNPMVNGPMFAMLQSRIQPEMQGRVFTLVGSLAGAMSPLGLAAAAPVADHLGIQVWWWIGGISCVLLAVGGLFIPALMRIEEEGPAESTATSQVQPAD